MGSPVVRRLVGANKNKESIVNDKPKLVINLTDSTREIAWA
jgi:hypothetical protein